MSEQLPLDFESSTNDKPKVEETTYNDIVYTREIKSRSYDNYIRLEGTIIVTKYTTVDTIIEEILTIFKKAITKGNYFRLLSTTRTNTITLESLANQESIARNKISFSFKQNKSSLIELYKMKETDKDFDEKLKKLEENFIRSESSEKFLAHTLFNEKKDGKNGRLHREIHVSALLSYRESRFLNREDSGSFSDKAEFTLCKLELSQ